MWYKNLFTVTIQDEDLMFFGNTGNQRKRTIRLKKPKKSTTKPNRDQADDEPSNPSGLLGWVKKTFLKKSLKTK